MEKDELYHIFDQQLHCFDKKAETAQDLIRRVASHYTLGLLRVGSIPFHFLETIIDDIEAEVVEMYRKKTYGFVSLEEYRKSLKKRQKKNDNQK